jgi:hypothetical protein
MKVEVKNNGQTVTVTGVEMWRINGHIAIQIETEEAEAIVETPIDARLVRGAFIIELHSDPAHACMGVKTQVLFIPTTDKEKRECENSMIYECPGRGYYSFLLVEWIEATDRKTHKVLWSKP